MLKVEFLELFRGGRQGGLPLEPAWEVRVYVEHVGWEELIQHYASRWQPMETVVLVVSIAEFILANELPPHGVIPWGDVPLAELAASGHHVQQHWLYLGK